MIWINTIKRFNFLIMKISFLFFFLFIACSLDKIYRKQLHNNEISIEWYHYSDLTSVSSDYIEVRKENKKELIFEHVFGLQDIELQNNTITILHLKFQTLPKIKKDSVFGYKIKYKEVTSHEMYLKYLEENNH
jgi:hypothetical protein